VAEVDDASACGWRRLTNHFPLERPEIFRRSERDRCDRGREGERERGLLWARRKRERGREGEWTCGWRLGEGGDGDEHLKI
jgi:hypothetical protein